MSLISKSARVLANYRDSISGWSNSVGRIGWRCRSCARLRYSSEGGALVSRGGPISRLLRMPCPICATRARSHGFLTCSPRLKRRRKRASAIFRDLGASDEHKQLWFSWQSPVLWTCQETAILENQIKDNSSALFDHSQNEVRRFHLTDMLAR